MKNNIKHSIKAFLPNLILNRLKKAGNKKAIRNWEKNNYPVPTPHIVKQNTIKDYQEGSGYTMLIETGTYLGDMVDIQKKRFKKIISIELGKDLYEKAKTRFRKDSHVEIFQGDSAKVLPVIMKDICEPVIFWLDGHFSGGITALGEKECPVLEEIDAIFSGAKLNHILLIDDAREFNGTHGYPTIETLIKHIKSKNKNYKIEVKYDIIRCVVEE